MNKNELRKQTIKDLLVLARQQGLKGVSRLCKEDLIAKLIKTAPAKPASPSRSKLIKATPVRPARTRYSTAAQPVPDQSGGASESLNLSAAIPVMPDQANAIPASAIPVPPVNAVQREAIDAKFFLGPENHAPLSSSLELPWTYNDNCLVLLARDPYWLYSYWDFSAEQISAAHARLGAKDAQLVLRLFDVTAIDFDGANAWSKIDVELTPFTTSWYIPVARPDASYCVEVGYRAANGHFAVLGRSNVVATPR
ncbi:MAG: DUF4912 domain-containing protein, partial [Candidatus Binatia bacterium]